MTQPTTPYRLHASRSSPPAPVPPDADLPAEVAGQPAAYFWKDIIHAGGYVHPTREFSLPVDPQRLQTWADTGTQMLAAGVAIPINCDHSDRARDVVGYVKTFKLDGDRLLALCQFIGPDAALMAARNLVSVGIDPDFTDGHARAWGEAIVHLALTPVPVVPDQDEFQQILDDSVKLPATAEQLDALRSELGDDLTPENCVARVLDALADDDDDDEDADDENLRTELSAARKEILELSTRIPPAMSDESQIALIESATARFDAAVERGGISPITRDRLVRTLVKSDDGRANLLALSRTANSNGSRALALAVADILLENQPISLGETTPLQTLSRANPGDEATPMDQLRSYMTRVASVG